MLQQQLSYADVIGFLARVEDRKRTKMNRRTQISAQQAAGLSKQHPDIPDDYVAYLREVGWGSFRECQFMVYAAPATPDQILGQGVFGWLKPSTRVLCFGDNFSGDLVGFLPDEKWAVVELWHDAGQVYPTKQSFGQYIRKQMLMGDNPARGRSSIGRARVRNAEVEGSIPFDSTSFTLPGEDFCQSSKPPPH